MMKKIASLILLIGLTFVNGELKTQPEQIHLSLGVNETQMIVTWVTFNQTGIPTVEYGRKKLDTSAFGSSSFFVDGGNEKRSMFIHRVTLNNLIPGVPYVYHCGSNDGWSSLYWFNAMKNGTDWSPRLAVFGDMGNINAQSLPRLQEEVQRGKYDAILHVGDFAYDMDSDNARVGDEFMRQIEPIAAYLPYQACPGNHEQKYNFSNYASRFTMIDQKSGSINNHYYSFNMGPAHIISFSTEFYYFLNYGWSQILRQYLWLEEDLREAAKPENRAQRPWIITMAHRPMYCSTQDGDDCTHKESIIRKGIPIVKAFGLEDLFYKYGVDLEIWAHEHIYERLLPVYDRKVYNGSTKAPYTNPKAPVHIITGSAGCQEKHDTFQPNPPEWTGFRSSDYGYTRLSILNKTHMHVEQISDDQGGAIIDDIWLEKQRHGYEAWF